MAIGAMLLAASSASAVPSSSAPGAPNAPVISDPASTSADGGTAPNAAFPLVESHLASGRFVTGAPPSTTGSIPSTVLDAYRRAVERANLTQPNCHLPLELLAAIGKVESGHARGGRVDETGRTLTPILGPVLNGGPFAAIRDTDGGTLDEDTSWDRAVGPMQFIPGTWSKWQSDGNTDGRRDPHNIYDAGLAAARYLCAANRDLGTPAGLDEAVLSYNHSTSYLALVRSWMAIYRTGTITIDDLTDFSSAPPEFTTPAAPTTPATPNAPPTSPPSPPPTTTPPSTPPSVPPSTPPSTPSTPPSTTPTTTTSEPPVDPPVPEECDPLHPEVVPPDCVPSPEPATTTSGG